MRKLVAGLAAACALLVGATAYQSLPNSKPAAAKHTAAYQRIDMMLRSLKAGNYKAACDVLAWYSANQYITDVQCAGLMAAQFPKGKMSYKIVGEEQGAPKYVVVTALMVSDNPATKVDEQAACEQAWAAGKNCVYAGVYTFGTALYGSPRDQLSGVKKPKLHWYVMWVN